MIRAIWFAIKVGVLLGVALWVVERPGSVRIEWMDYTISIALGFFLLIGIGVILLSIFIYQVIKTFVDFPKSFARYNEIRRQEKGYKALTIGLAAVAAGDTKAALKQARKTEKFMPHDTGLPLLLKAQAARLDGRNAEAEKIFLTLIENKEASFLGIRGLLQSALDHADHETALSLAEKALSLYPKQPWILKIAYDLQTRAQHWSEAYQTLRNAEKYAALDPEKCRSDRAALLLAQAMNDEKEGFQSAALANAKSAALVDRTFTPAPLMLAGLYDRLGKRKKALRVLEKAWEANPHPALLREWVSLKDSRNADDPAASLQWIEKLLKFNPDSVYGLMMAGQAALEASFWGIARTYLEKAEGVEPCAEVYRLRARLEELSGSHEATIREYLQRAALSPPARVWICQETGRLFDEWSPQASPHGSFNTIIWDYPVRMASAEQLDVSEEPVAMIGA